MRNFTDKELHELAKKLSTKIALTATRYEFIDFCTHYTTLPNQTLNILNKALIDKNLTPEDEIVLREILIDCTHPKCMFLSVLNAIWWNILIPIIGITAIVLIGLFI